jgi:hypothetical protein
MIYLLQAFCELASKLLQIPTFDYFYFYVAKAILGFACAFSFFVFVWAAWGEQKTLQFLKIRDGSLEHYIIFSKKSIFKPSYSIPLDCIEFIEMTNDTINIFGNRPDDFGVALIGDYYPHQFTVHNIHIKT